MYRSFRISFSKDHNMVIEEFDFYQKLPPKMQSELIEHCFAATLRQFRHVFILSEDAFRNELVINMYQRQLTCPRQSIIEYG